jgi:hypothetical protein
MYSKLLITMITITITITNITKINHTRQNQLQRSNNVNICYVKQPMPDNVQASILTVSAGALALNYPIQCANPANI